MDAKRIGDIGALDFLDFDAPKFISGVCSCRYYAVRGIVTDVVVFADYFEVFDHYPNTLRLIAFANSF